MIDSKSINTLDLFLEEYINNDSSESFNSFSESINSFSKSILDDFIYDTEADENTPSSDPLLDFLHSTDCYSYDIDDLAEEFLSKQEGFEKFNNIEIASAPLAIHQNTYKVQNLDKKTKFSPHELSEIIKSQNNFAIINESLHLYDNEYGYYINLEDSNSPHNMNKYIRRCIPELARPYVTRYTIPEICEWLRIQKDLIVPLYKLDKKQHYLNFKDCVLNIKTGELLNHDSSFYFTNYINANYLDQSNGSLFKEFITQITGDNIEIEHLLQEVLGYAISEIRNIKKAAIFYGPRNCAKSTFLELMGKLIGDTFCSNLSLHQLNDKFSLSLLYGKKLNKFGEIDERQLKYLSIFKAITGGDTVTADRKNTSPIAFKNKAFLAFCGNSLPNLGTTDAGNAFFNRLLIVPFPISIPTDSQDPNILSKLLKEKSYIVKWACDGLSRFIENGYVFTSCDIEIPEFNTCNTSNLNTFIEDACLLDPDLKISSRELFTAYNNFCELNNIIPLDKNSLFKEIKSLPFIVYKRMRLEGSLEWGFQGICLKCMSNTYLF